MPRRPIWLWPNLLSLDAPLVALAWFWIFKQAWLVKYHQPALPWLLAVVVWCVYVADRLIDERMAAMGSHERMPRHEFHGRWRKPFTWALMFGTLASMGLLLIQPRGLWTHGAFVAVLVVGYFTMAFLESGRGISYSKNLLAGLSFGYGTAVGVHFYKQDALVKLFGSSEVIAFGVLCALNITAINYWEHSRHAKDPEEKASYELVVSLFLILLVGFCFFMALRVSSWGDQGRKAFFTAIMISAASLQVINKVRGRFSLDALRVLADLAMLLPVPVFYAMIKMAE